MQRFRTPLAWASWIASVARVDGEANHPLNPELYLKEARLRCFLRNKAK